MVAEDLAKKIAFVCSDMWKPDLRVIRERCAGALNILDCFHVVAKSLPCRRQDERCPRRRAPAKRAGSPRTATSPSSTDPLVYAKRKTNLTGDPRSRLRDLPGYNLKTVRAYLVKEDFQQFWE
jgi:transposase